MYLKFVKVATSAVCDFDFLFALVLGNEPFKSAVANALQGMREVKEGGGCASWSRREVNFTVICWATESSTTRGMLLQI
jgi:hypothetical protein